MKKYKTIGLLIFCIIFFYLFMYSYIPAGNGVIYKINRYTNETYYLYPGGESWEKIKPYKQTLLEEFDKNYKPKKSNYISEFEAQDKPLGGPYDDLLDQIKK